jgi:transposase
VRPSVDTKFEVRFEAAPGEQAQADFAQFQVAFTDEPTTPRIVWLFPMVLGYSRLLWARFVMHQDLATVLRCHVAAFEAFGGAPREILYDRMKTAVTGEGDRDGIVYNRALIDLARHYGFYPKACQPYRAKTKGKVERPFRYIREPALRCEGAGATQARGSAAPATWSHHGRWSSTMPLAVGWRGRTGHERARRADTFHA